MEERQIIDISLLEENLGQIYDVPSNPRKISIDKMQALKRSIENLPEMISMRELLVYRNCDRYVVLAGNMRLKACKEMGYKTMPCKVIPADTPKEKIRAIIMQDNNSYGEMDWDAILADWDLDELRDLKIDLPEEYNVTPDDYKDSFSLPDGQKESRQISFIFTNEQADEVEGAIESMLARCDVTNCGSKNKKGNALYMIVKEWEEQRK